MQQPTIPAPLAAAFEKQVTISAAELCRLIPMNDATLRRHVRAGHIAFVKIGIGATAPRRFTLEHVLDFLQVRSERECQSTNLLGPHITPMTSGGAAGGLLALRAKRNAEKLKQRSGA